MPQEDKARTKLCRICWNTAGWRHPTGEARRQETEGSYVHDHGFGHEEWLLNFERQLASPNKAPTIGYKYAHLQAIGKYYSTYAGSTFGLVLYTIDSTGRRLVVAAIRNCYIPREDELRSVYDSYRRNGWIREMKADLDRVGGNSALLETEKPKDMFNIRFRQVDVTLADPWVVLPKGHKAYRTNRYQPLNSDSTDSYIAAFKLNGTAAMAPVLDPKRNERTRTRAGIDPTKYEPAHIKLQNRLFDYLVHRFGRSNVGYEQDYVDLGVTFHRTRILIEIKTDGTARRCIRAAVGQLMEYAYYNPHSSRSTRTQLVIVGDAPTTALDKEYLAFVRKRFLIPVSYSQWSWEAQRLTPDFDSTGLITFR